MVSNGPVLLNSMSKDEFSFSQSSALGSSKESGSHADFKFGSGNTDCEMNCNVRSLAEHFMSSNRPNVGGTAAKLGGEATAGVAKPCFRQAPPPAAWTSQRWVAWSPVSHLLDRQNRVVGRRWREAGVAAKQSSGRSSSRIELQRRRRRRSVGVVAAVAKKKKASVESGGYIPVAKKKAVGRDLKVL
nr:WD repeat-containing protein 44-like [Ipomoea batatas]